MTTRDCESLMELTARACGALEWTFAELCAKIRTDQYWARDEEPMAADVFFTLVLQLAAVCLGSVIEVYTASDQDLYLSETFGV